MDTAAILNPHCNIPFLSKEKHRWCIRFYYHVDGARRSKKQHFDLNSSRYIQKTSTQYKEINKIERKAYAEILLSQVKESLRLDYFNPYTLEFECSDLSEKPFLEYLDKFIDHNPHLERSDSTKRLYRSYNSIIKAYFIKKGYSSIKLNQVTRKHIETFLIDRKSDSGSTVQRDNYVTYLRSFFNYCVDYEELLPKNPLKLLHRINANTSKTNKAYPRELLVKVFEEAEKLDECFFLLLKLIYYTLRRPQELLNVRYRDIDFQARTIDFDSDIIKTNKKQYSKVRQELLGRIMSGIPKGTKPNHFLFGTVNEKVTKTEHRVKSIFGAFQTPLHHFQDKFKTLKQRLGLEDGYTLYSMKHSGVVYLIEVAKWTDKQIMDYTGHTNVAILGRYARDAKRSREDHPDTI
ncbi:hypothetical protein ASE92_12585 [Pedobacter sp. Leaf41]|uniref:site-specific integrase n=1 Tax=Pedobacter sp. Leaf41 TaxID=1736218 RepID=UPI000702DD6C|nr:site-specific integrase [Pedobacter sp. Leaf41]KQN34429.1 hypothetical protein ASE92_12585 [Pedobacter sp. Leaf41]